MASARKNYLPACLPDDRWNVSFLHLRFATTMAWVDPLVTGFLDTLVKKVMHSPSYFRGIGVPRRV